MGTPPLSNPQGTQAHLLSTYFLHMPCHFSPTDPAFLGPAWTCVQLRIGHDDSGFGSAWHLAKIEVINTNTGEQVCGFWGWTAS